MTVKGLLQEEKPERGTESERAEGREGKWETSPMDETEARGVHPLTKGWTGKSLRGSPREREKGKVKKPVGGGVGRAKYKQRGREESWPEGSQKAGGEGFAGEDPLP